jgi:hypothetical protein
MLVSRVTAVAVGLVPGFRVWDLTAYDASDNIIARVNRDMGKNEKKFRAFVEAVDHAGYMLTSKQTQYIKTELLLHLPQVDNETIRAATQGCSLS